MQLSETLFITDQGISIDHSIVFIAAPIHRPAHEDTLQIVPNWNDNKVAKNKPQIRK